MPNNSGSIFVAIKCKGTQHTKQLGRAEAMPGVQLRGWCVHAIGGESGKTLTQHRRDAIRKAHNKKAHDDGGRCSLHVNSWKSKLGRKCGIVVHHRPVPAPAAPAAPAAPVQAAARAAHPPPQNIHTQLQSFMEQLDDNRDNISDGTYLRVANVLHTAFHQAGAQ